MRTNTITHPYRTFFVIDEARMLVFVGKTYSRQLQPLIRKFVYSSCSKARDAFAPLPIPSFTW